MARSEVITGKIIRITDPETVVINLGSERGIQADSIFHVLGTPETIIDPFSHEELGSIVIVKAKLKAAEVLDKFTIATTKWVKFNLKDTLGWNAALVKALGMYETELVEQEGVLNLEQIQPWKSVKEEPVSIGDTVEVRVPVPDVEISRPEELEQPAEAGVPAVELGDLVSLSEELEQPPEEEED